MRARLPVRAFVVACAAGLVLFGALSTDRFGAVVPAATNGIDVADALDQSEIAPALDGIISRPRAHLPNLPSVRPPIDAVDASTVMALGIVLLARFGLVSGGAAPFRFQRVDHITTRGPPFS